MKRYKKLLIAALAALAATSLVACFGGKKAEQRIEYIKTEKKLSVSFSSAEKSLTIGDTFLLQPIYDKLDGYSIKYSSDNSSVISVDEQNGMVTALNAGSANVKAVYTNGVKSAEATIAITSDFGNYLPELRLDNVLESEGLTLYKKATFKLNPIISFNGVNFYDGEYSYSVADTSVATISGGVITAVKNGSTTLTVSGTWRDISVKESFSVTVKDRVVFYNDGVALVDKTIYMTDSVNGVSYETSIPNKFTVSVNGKEYKTGVKCTVEHNDIARPSGATIVAQRFGQTTATVTAEVGGVTASQSFSITVLRPEIAVSGTVPMFATDYGTYLTSDNIRETLISFAGITDSLVDAYQGNNALTIDGDHILGVTSSNQGGRGSAEITLGTAKLIYRMQLETVAKFFTTASDLKALEIHSDGIRTGYYELLNDIDASGLEEITHETKSAAFGGVFDGKGHVIKNLTVEKGKSVFGALKTATVKNLALDNLTASGANFLQHFNGQESGLTIKDVYIKLSEQTAAPRGLLSYSGSGNNIQNVVIEYTGENASSGDYIDCAEAGVLACGISRGANDEGTAIKAPNDNCWKDIYVISPYILAYQKTEGYAINTDKPNPSVPLYVFGANETTDLFGRKDTVSAWCKENSTDKWLTLSEIAETIKKQTKSDEAIDKILNSTEFNESYTAQYFNMQFSRVYHYDSVAALKEAISNKTDDSGEKIPASTTLASFSADYWDISSGTPVWKTL